MQQISPDGTELPEYVTSPRKMTTQDAIRGELVARELRRRRLIEFVKYFHGSYQPGWVHYDICRRLEQFSKDVVDKKSPRLMLLMPPRHGKSEIISKMFPAWHLGIHPEHELIGTSYNISLATDFSRRIRDILRTDEYAAMYPGTSLHPDFQGAEAWRLHKARGGYVAAGVGGGITGKGANILTIDDPVKSHEESDSETIRDSIWNWYTSTAYTRLAPGGGVLVVQTCWHDDDLAGRLQRFMQEDPEFDQFEVIKYPAIAEEDELHTSPEMARFSKGSVDGKYLVRSKGDPLHPDRYDTKQLAGIKKTLGPRHWSALYQQNPVPDDGNYFSRENFDFRDHPHGICTVYQAWDFAISEKAQNDYTVGTTGYHDENDVIHVTDLVRFKSGSSIDIVEAMLNQAVKHSEFGMPLIGVEDGQIWRSISKLFEKRCQERGIYPAVEVLKPLTDKMARARPLQGRMQQHMIVFPHNTEWVTTVMGEMLRFPSGLHDDIVDSLAWLAHLIVDKVAPRKAKQQKLKSWKDKLSSIGLGERTHMSA